ncbi:MAG: Arm DNA-binding domain-containing protein [Sphingopyxis sp.]|uniref:Arm DNA-binding domain-containing protein n=1 Tax=Sphingopyxis sp. TaxID=1908224 RepID=UPI003D6D6EFB
MPLTETQARNSKPSDRAYKLADGEGLFLFVQPNGSKLWRMPLSTSTFFTHS